MIFVYVALGWSLGIALARHFPVLPPLYWLVLLAVYTAMLHFYWHKKAYRTGLILLIALALGAIRYQWVPTASPLQEFVGVGNIRIEGNIVAYPDVRDTRTLLRVEVDSIQTISEQYTVNDVLLVQTENRRTDLLYGDRVVAVGRVYHPPIFDTFSYAAYLERFQIFVYMPQADVEANPELAEPSIFRSLNQVRIRAEQQITKNLPQPESGLLTGILLGNERNISPDLEDDFEVVGAAHIIAISGFNMVIISQIIHQFLGIFTRKRIRTALISVVLIALYTILVGANPAVTRAAVMSSVLVFGTAIRRKTFVPNSVGVVVLLLSILNPLILWDVGFQLSVFAVLGLVFLSDPIRRLIEKLLQRVVSSEQQIKVILNWLGEPVIATLAATLMILPLTIHYFGYVSVVNLPVNILIVPVQPMLLVVGAVATIASPFLPSITVLLYWFDLVFLSWTISVVRWFADLPFAAIALRNDPLVVISLYGLVLGGALMSINDSDWTSKLRMFVSNRRWLILLGGINVLVLVLMINIVSSLPDGKLHAWFLNVGHHNAVLLQTPSGHQILIDGGDFPSRLTTQIGDRMPFYDRHLEVVVITHPDEYELDALPQLMQRYTADLVLDNGQMPEITEENKRLKDWGESTVIARAGYQVDLGDGVLLEVLHPDGFLDNTVRQPDGSLVVRVSYREQSVLLTSDLTEDGQKLMMEQGRNFESDVFQVPQHGRQSSLSQDFLNLVSPSLVIIQTDASNFFGDPDTDVLAMVEPYPVLRTDQNGIVHIWTDGESLWSQVEST